MRRLFAGGFFGVIASLVTAATANALEKQAGAPTGFEQLAAERASAITLYYGGDLLGNFTTHVTPQSVKFDDADAVLATLPNVGNKEAVRKALLNAMPTNADQLCTTKRTENCGTLKPETVGLIYDENQLRGELFIQPRLLALVDDTGARYLPLPKDDFSSVYGFAGAINGQSQQTPTYALSNASTFAMGEKKLVTQTTLTNQGLRFDTAAASVEREGVNTTAGLLQSQPMQLISDRDIAGVSISSSRRTILDGRKSEGNAVIVFLPRQSFVSIYREGRLYSSRSYEAGNQQIDTSELPDGAYDITLKIQEADGAARSEKRFFAKSLDLPPPGEPTYVVQAGLIRAPASQDSTVPELTGNPLLRIGTSRRVTDNVGLTVSTLGLKDRAISEGGLAGFAPVCRRARWRWRRAKATLAWAAACFTPTRK